MVSSTLTILASSDIHAPKFLPQFRKALAGAAALNPDLFILAGDVVEKGKAEFCSYVSAAIKERFNVEIVGVYGNEEYDEIWPNLQNCGIKWLNDQLLLLKLKDVKLAIVGTRGVLDRPTPWQERNIPNIAQIYAQRLKKLDTILSEARRAADTVMLVTHYPPLCDTFKGEDARFASRMASKRLLKIVFKNGVDIVVHGHLHKSKVHFDTKNSTKIYNVALPAVGKIVKIEIRKQGLLQFM